MPDQGDHIVRLARIIHVISAFWVVLLALIIFVDVTGRQLFNLPLTGAAEIIKNSVVSITFLQLPLAIYRGGMIRTTLVYDRLGEDGKRLIRTFAGVLGLLFFLAVVIGSWEPFLQAWEINEYEGEGALRVPTYPVRFLVIVTSAFSAFVYFYLMFLDWTGGSPDEESEMSGA